MHTVPPNSKYRPESVAPHLYSESQCDMVSRASIQEIALGKPDIPQEDLARLQTLRSLNILDSQPEERFDRLTRMAKRIFGVPIALVTLVDERRQWFKSSVGLNIRETSRDISFCGHTILGDEAFVIPNAKEDDRFNDNPLVTGDPRIRFYAGCPLNVNGHKVGTLCIIDTAPRSLAHEDVQMLKDLTCMVERELTAIHLATWDELTRVWNRRGFEALAEHTLRLCSRQKSPATLIFMDLDKLKPINDTFGHTEGDLALVAFASQMKSCLRDSDLIARLGGDEFVVLLANATEQDAVKVIERFNDVLSIFNREADRGYNVEYSHGIVEFDVELHLGIEDLLARADMVMYEAKKIKRRDR